MSDLENKINETLDLLSSYKDNLKSNIKSLYDEINNIEDVTLEKSKASFDLIKEDVSSLEELIKGVEEKIETQDDRLTHEMKDLKVEYFNSLNLIKNDLMNFMIENLDSLETSLDNYHNTTLEKIESLVLKTKELESSSINTNDSISQVLGKSLDQYSSIIKNYYEHLSADFEGIITKIKELQELYTLLYNDYKIKLIEDNKAYKEELDSNNISQLSYKDILNDENFLYENLEKIENDIKNKYVETQESLYQEFKELSDKEIKKYERILIETLGFKKDFFESKKNTLKLIKKEIKENPLNKKLFIKLENAFNDEELENCITEIFKSYHHDLYLKYLSLEEANEKEYRELLLRYRNQNLFKKLLIKDEKFKGSAIIENIIFFKKYSDLLDLLFEESVDNRLKHTLEFSLKQLELFDTLKRVLITYKYKSSLLLNELNFSLNVAKVNMEREIFNLIKSANENYKLFNIYRNEIYASDLKFQAVLDYEIKLNKVHRSYVIQKAILFLSNSLAHKSRDIDLLPKKFEYEKIINSYNVNKKSLDIIKSSQTALLEQTKAREELFALSSFEFLNAFMKHRITSASELIELAQKELELRIEILTKEKNVSNGFSEYRINFLVGKFLDEIKELNQIKEIRLNAILLKLDAVREKPASFKDRMTEETNEILTDYNDSVNDIIKIIKKDTDINYSRSDIDERIEVYIDNLDIANKIHNHSLLEATKSIKIAESEIDSIVNTLNSKDSFNFNDIYNKYQSDYNNGLERIDNILDKELTPVIDEIRRISSKYNDDDYNISYRRTSLRHQKEINSLHQELTTKIESIDNENKLQFLSMEDVSSNTLNSIDEINNSSIETINYYKQVLDNNNLYSKNEFDDSIIALKQCMDSYTKAIIDDFDEFSSALNEKNDIVYSLSKNAYGPILKAGKDSINSYKFEKNAFIYDYKTRYKTLIKEINNKYDHPSVYVLNGRKDK